MEIFSNIRKFFSLFWRGVTWVRTMLVNIIFLAVLALFVTAFFTGSKSQTVSPGSVLVLDPSGVLVEQRAAPEPAEALFKELGRSPRKDEETKVQDLIDAIRMAATDPNIQSMVIDPRDLQGCDTTKLVDIGKALRDFKQNGKKILAHATLFTQGQYLLASHADTIYINPLGGVAITGFGLYQTYFKGLLDKTKVNFHVFRVGEYKSAVEPFLRESMSDLARESGQGWLNALWQAYLGEVARNRGISPASLISYVENIDSNLRTLGGDSAKLAKSYKLVDDIKTSDQFDLILAGNLGKTPETLNRISFRDYLLSKPAKLPSTEETIGVIRARGPIMPDNQPDNMIGSQTIAKLFQQARDDSSIVAVVLRIDSPGGSATASEEIHHEIARTQEAGKPVVVSMGSLAASGAYWIASGANRIVASPTTLTGSIGIFAAFPTFEGTAKEFGITSDGIGTTGMADVGNPLRPLSPTTESVIQHLLQFGYDIFLDRVASGRRLPVTDVEKSAQGQVFVGKEAHERKLVDQLGDLDDAVKAAADLAGLTTVRSKELQRERSPHEVLMDSLFNAWSGVAPPHPLSSSPLLAMLQRQTALLATFTDPSHIYARSLECEAAMY